MFRSRPLCPGQQIPPAVWGGSVRGSPRRRCPWPKPRAEGVAPQPSAFSFYYTSQHLGFSFYTFGFSFYTFTHHSTSKSQEQEHALFTHSPVHVHIHIRNPQTYPAPCTGLSVTHSLTRNNNGQQARMQARDNHVGAGARAARACRILCTAFRVATDANAGPAASK